MSDQLRTIPYTDETAKEIVRKFCGHVHWLISVRYIYKVLFEDKQPSCQALMEKTRIVVLRRSKQDIAGIPALRMRQDY